MPQWIYVVVITMLMACRERTATLRTAASVTSLPSYPTVLPQTIKNYLQTTFPQWQIVEKSDYSKTWWSFYDSSYNPCWARTDINDDQLADYALWLKKDMQLQLVICTGKDNQSFSHTIVIDSANAFSEKSHNLSMGVAIAPPAQIDVAKPRIQSLILKSNGFALLELEEQTRIYYQERDRIQTFFMK